MASISPICRSNMVAFGYASIGFFVLGYVLLIAWVLTGMAGQDLWHMSLPADTVAQVSIVSGVNFVMAILAYRFVERPFKVQVITLLVAFSIFAAVVSQTLLGLRTTKALSPGALAQTLAFPLWYGLLAYELLRLSRISKRGSNRRR
jgi:hypothetical protein